MYPRPVFIAAAVLDFFPIDGTRQAYREIGALYRRFGHADRIGMTEGYHKHNYSVENQVAAIAFLDRFNDLPIARGAARHQGSGRCRRAGDEDGPGDDRPSAGAERDRRDPRLRRDTSSCAGADADGRVFRRRVSRRSGMALSDHSRERVRRRTGFSGKPPARRRSTESRSTNTCCITAAAS